MNWICFTPFPHQTKYPLIRDLGALSVGLMEIGEDVRYLRFESGEPISGPPFTTVSYEDAENPLWWKKSGADVVVMMFGSNNITKYYHAINIARIPLIIRMDTDGYLFPRQEWFRYLNILAVSRMDQSLRNGRKQSLVHAYCYAFLKTLLFSFSAGIIEKRILRRLELGALLWIESPLAGKRFHEYLSKHNHNATAKKIFVSSPPIICEKPFSGSIVKQSVILSVGEWWRYQKDTPLMVRSVVEALNRNRDYKWNVVGKGVQIVDSLLSGVSPDTRARIHLIDRLPRSDIDKFYSESQILFLASRFEGFPNVSAEAACWGCSIVGWSGISAFQYFASSNAGSCANERNVHDFSEALIAEIAKWNNGSRNATRIAEWARSQFPASKVADSLRSLVQKRLPMFSLHSEIR